MKVTVTLVARPPGPPEINWQVASLEFLLWVTIPFLPWWIGDVAVDPGLEVHVELYVARKGAEAEDRFRQSHAESFRAPAVVTNLRERHGLLSWSTPGTLILPPFVFSQGDPEQLVRTISESVRSGVVREIAEIIRNGDLGQEEVLVRPSLRRSSRGLALSFHANKLVRLEVTLDGPGAASVAEPIQIRRGERDGLQAVDLPARIAASAREGQLLRVEAMSESRQYYWYSLRVPPQEGSEER